MSTFCALVTASLFSAHSMAAAAANLRLVDMPNDIINLVSQSVNDPKILVLQRQLFGTNLMHQGVSGAFSLSTGALQAFNPVFPVGPLSFYANAASVHFGGDDGTDLALCKNDPVRVASLNRSTRQVAPFSGAAGPSTIEWGAACTVDPGVLAVAQSVNICIGPNACFSWANRKQDRYPSTRADPLSVWMMSGDYGRISTLAQINGDNIHDCCWVGSNHVVALHAAQSFTDHDFVHILDVHRNQWNQEVVQIGGGIAAAEVVAPMDDNVFVTAVAHHTGSSQQVYEDDGPDLLGTIFVIKDMRVDNAVSTFKLHDVGAPYDMIAIPGTGGSTFLAADNGDDNNAHACVYDFRSLNRVVMGNFGSDARRFMCGIF